MGVKKISVPGFGFTECCLAKEMAKKLKQRRTTEFDARFRTEVEIQRKFMDAELK